eukprot:840701-Amphidinium_carterae.1
MFVGSARIGVALAGMRPPGPMPMGPYAGPPPPRPPTGPGSSHSETRNASHHPTPILTCLLYTSDAADDTPC